MRVLHAISGIDPTNGGPTQALLGLTAAQARAGLHVHVVSTWMLQAGLDNAETFRSARVGMTMVGPATGKLNAHPELRPTLEKLAGDADVVHIHSLWQEAQHAAATAARKAGVPYVMRACGGLHPWSMNQSRWRKRLYLAWRLRRHLNRAAAIHFTTHAERDAAFAVKAPAIVEPNGTELAGRPLPDRAAAERALREKYPALGDRPILLFLGRVHAKKGLDRLMPALADARLDVPPALLIAGPEEDAAVAAEVRRIAAERGMTDRVIFTGPLDRAGTIEALSGAGMLVLTSYTENFGIAVIEALAVGTPVLVSDRVECIGYFGDVNVGPIVPLEHKAIVEALETWVPDDERRRAAGLRGARLAAEKFDWDQIAGRWIGHYEAMVGR
ncbi:MAG: glycosyltransferase [Planctomycetota bacterium]